MTIEAKVTGLFLAVAPRQPMRPVVAAEAVATRGLAGCRHAEKPAGGKRQVLLMDEASPAALGLVPGQMKENIVIAGLPLESLPPGQRLAVGGAILELTEPAEPCERLEAIRPGLKQEAWGRRGQLARVVSGGPIALGDGVRLLAAAAEPAAAARPQLPG